jgi:hypothetical protein
VVPGNDDLIRRAARNNADWCDAVCRAHRCGGYFRPEIWINRAEVPPLYPNAITLTQNNVEAQLQAIAELDRGALSGAWAVKDSFASLDLAPLGFTVGIQAQWIVRHPSAPLQDARDDRLRWEKITREDALERWEIAWSAAAGNRIANQREPIFNPALLNEAGVAFIAAYEDKAIVAGCIGNGSKDLVGISNLFASRHADTVAAGCVAAIIKAFPGAPIVGYETRPFLSRRLGFEAIGPLKIWFRNARN